jgi:hypothetical protein
MVAAVCAVVAYQRAVAEQQQVRIRVEEGAARVAAEAVDMPSVSGWAMLAYDMLGRWSGGSGGGRKARGWRWSRRGIHTEFKGLAFLEDLSASLARIYDLVLDRRLWVGPGTLHDVLAMYVSVKEQWWRAARVLPRGCRRACAGAEGTIRRRAASWTSWFRRSSGRSQKFAPRYQARERSRVETAQKQSQQPEGASVHWRTASVRDEG